MEAKYVRVGVRVGVRVTTVDGVLWRQSTLGLGLGLGLGLPLWMVYYGSKVR